MDKLKLCDEIVLEEFKDIRIIDESGQSFPVPIVWGTDERALLAFTMVTDGEDFVVDKIKLPYMNLCLRGYTPQHPSFGVGAASFSVHYSLSVCTLYMEEMNQVVEQILLKFAPTCATSKLGYYLPLELKFIASNLNHEDELEKIRHFSKKDLRVVKYRFDLVLNASFDKLKAEEV